MKLTPEHIDQTRLLTADGIYDCCLVQQRFAYKLFNNSVSSMGDVVLFSAPTKIGPLALNDAIIVAAELPNATMFGGVCFARLYAAQFGSILSSLLDLKCTVDESCLFVNDKQASLTMINQVKDSVLINFVFPLLEGNTEEAFYTFKLNEEQRSDFENSAIHSFNQLVRSVFIETRRDNF